ncbi:hypothetical protein WJX81_000201 [Elliptochloris bilobata]|uniref:Serine aminopeptidase S33 domain-containing protein n=1 Tax=Elliptochloris bilobata TaxID=381761 RepID=A0AAW1RI11_9CHLO
MTCPLGERVVRFKNQRNIELCGTLRYAGGRDIVLLVHGLMSLRDRVRFPEIAVALADKGVSSLRFDLSGNGDSGGTFSYANSWGEAEDIHAAVLYARSELEREVTGLLGHSKGGLAVLLYACQHDDVPRVVGLAPSFSRKAGLQEVFGYDDTLATVAKEGKAEVVWRGVKTPRQPHIFCLTQQEARTLDMAQHCPCINRTRVLLVHGAKDVLVPLDASRSYGKHIEGAAVRVIADGDHNFDAPGPAKEMIAAVVDFFTSASNS